MDILTIAQMFAEFLPDEYHLCHVKDHATGETSFVIRKAKTVIADVTKGYSDSPEVRIYRECTKVEDVEALEQALQKHNNVYPNRHGNFRYIEKGETYADHKRYAISQLRPVSKRDV